ncbi:hypothetical protein NE237_007508 [Protea cynaroides]|uniref:Uncharacterized protein n=1 Tax=Protea cynaroides TaxID=273540 RepID=A0A9Q0KQB0_9MAGN|nr:hypothetical protein NE237_007508 [Protea cynaroides]
MGEVPPIKLVLRSAPKSTMDCVKIFTDSQILSTYLSGQEGLPSNSVFVVVHDIQYLTLKSNVDALNLIQLGLNFSNIDENMPELGIGNRYISEFNFKDFDVFRDKHALNSIELLRRQGMDFEKNSEMGIDSSKFAKLVKSSGLICNDSVSWGDISQCLRFGYLVKILTS